MENKKLVGLVGVAGLAEMLDSVEGLAQITKIIGRMAGKDYKREDLIEILDKEGYTDPKDIEKFFEIYNSL